MLLSQQFRCYIKIGLTNFLKRGFCGTKDVWCNHAWKSSTPLVICLLILVLSSPSSMAGAFFVAALLGQWTVEQCSKSLVVDENRHRGLKKPGIIYHNQREIRRVAMPQEIEQLRTSFNSQDTDKILGWFVSLESEWAIHGEILGQVTSFSETLGDLTGDFWLFWHSTIL